MFSKLTHVINRWFPPLLWMSIILKISATQEPFRFLSKSSIEEELSLPLFGQKIDGFLDYPYHFLVYLVLAFLIARALVWQGDNQIKWYILAFLLVMSISLIDEVQQLYVPKRNFEAVDLLMDGLGGISGLLLYWYFYERRK